MRKTLAVLSVIALGAAAAQARPGPRHRALELRAPSKHSLLALRNDRHEGGARLARVHPRSLRFRRGSGLDVDEYAFGWSFSPQRSLLALGHGSYGDLLIVDPLRLRTVRTIETGVDGYVVATTWAGSRVVAAVSYCCEPDSSVRILTIDAATGSVVVQRDLAASLARVATVPGGLVLLVGPADGIGPARIVVARADEVRIAELTDIQAGRELEKGEPEPTVRWVQPGLAVEPDGRRAFAVGAGAPIAEVDLTSLGVEYHDLSAPISLTARLRNWLEPAAEAKTAPIGPVRTAEWIGNGLLAVAGYDADAWVDGNGDVRSRQTAAGVRIIDTRNWSERVLDPDASDFAVADGALLTWTSTWDSSREVQVGTGLTAYGSDGSPRLHLFGSQSIYNVQVVNGRALVRRNVARRPTALVDLVTGRVLRRQAEEPPWLLLGTASPGY